jgi:tRNA threonylcarbamoyladenosine biosynthesis protein TsaB
LILFSCEIELTRNINCKMNKLIIDAAKDKIFLMIINNDINYSITHENSKINYEKLSILINDFLNKKKLNLDKVSQIYVNRGPGSFAGIRNSLSVVKAFHLTHKIDYYCFSFEDFGEKNEVKYENIPNLCEKLKVEKNLINPIYLS